MNLKYLPAFSNRALLLLILYPLFSGAYAQDDTLIIDEDAGLTLEMEAATLPPPASAPRVHGALTLGAGADVKSALADNAGHASATRESVLAALDFPISKKISLGASFEREWSQYDFDLNSPSVSDIGYLHLSITRFGLISRCQISRDWLLMVIVDATFSIEDHVEWTEGMTYGGIVMIRQQVNKSFAWQVGVIARTRLNDSPLVLPVPGIDWKINDRFSLRTAQGVTFTCDLFRNKHWLLDFGANFENRVYRMDSRSQLPDGMLIDRRIPLLAALTFQPRRGTFVKIGAATPFILRRYKFCESDGDTAESFDGDAAPYFYFSAGSAF